jgi:hypothetical protein
MNNDAFIVPTSPVKDIPGFPKLFCMIAAHYMEHVVECEDVANVKKRRRRVDGGAKRYAVPVCLPPADRVMSPGTGRPVHIANKTRLL